MRHSGIKAQDAIVPQLLEEGLITHEALQRARAIAQQDGTESVVYHLVQMNAVAPGALLQVLSDHFRVPGVSLAEAHLDEKLLARIDAETAFTHRVLPLSSEGRRFRVAMADPRDINAIDAVQFALGASVSPVVADTYTLARKINQSYNRTGEQLQRALLEFGAESEISSAPDALSSVQEEIDEAPIVRLIQATLQEAVKKGASDIHIEPVNKKELRFRFRIDGVLREIDRTSIRMRDAIMSRIKIMAELNIAEKLRPQDGRLNFPVGNRVIDVRVAIIPTSRGEKAVLRILDKAAVSLDLDMLGLDARGLEVLKRALKSPYGMILATGPTGAGKSTTLYSMLLTLPSDTVNILTVEDPVEYELDGINQTPVRADHGMGFSEILRSFLRHDPNVIMVGEIRDTDTIETAIRAAHTGHLVLSTLHANDAVNTFTRMVDLGAPRFNIASVVTVVMAQRLARKICTKCREKAEYSPEWLRLAGFTPQELDGLTFYRGVGCPDCDHTGYAGRIGLYEVLPVTATIRSLILDPDVSEAQIKDVACREGMKTLRQIGIERAAAGITTLEEVIKETGSNA